MRPLNVIGIILAFLALVILLTPRAPDNELHSRVSSAGTLQHLPGFGEYDRFTKENSGTGKESILDPSSIDHADND